MAEMSDLDLAVATLLAKTTAQSQLFDYYEGRHPLVYSHDGLRDIFQRFSAHFTQNWCAVVVDSIAERLNLQRIAVADDEAATDRLAELLTSSELLLEADSVHLATLVAGEAYVIAWPDEETGEPETYYHDPRMAHVFYDSTKPRAKRFGTKWWVGDDGYRYITLYYADRLEYYRSLQRVRTVSDTGTYHNEVTSGKSFGEERPPASNPYGVVPVFHFRGGRSQPVSELRNVIGPQNAINKLLADMMVAAEFGAFPQRWIISQSDPGKFKNAPNHIWDIPGSDGTGQPTSVGQFDPTQLSNYMDAIDKWTTAVAIISRTPKHYFFAQGGAPSGEALIAMEAPLNHKAQKHIDRFTATWSEVAAFVALVGGMGVLDDNAIVPIFEEPQTIQPYTRALIRKEAVAVGIPLRWQLEQEGYTEQELDDLDQARADESSQRATIGEELLRSFERGGQA